MQSNRQEKLHSKSLGTLNVTGVMLTGGGYNFYLIYSVPMAETIAFLECDP